MQKEIICAAIVVGMFEIEKDKKMCIIRETVYMNRLFFNGISHVNSFYYYDKLYLENRLM